MLWVLENYDNVLKLKEDLNNVNIVNEAFSVQMPVAPLHWMVSDGNMTIVIEQTRSGLKIYDNKVGILTNSPDFRWQLVNLDNYVGLTPRDSSTKYWNGQEIAPLGVGTGSLGLPGNSIPASRFVKAAYLNANYPIIDGEKENVAKFFNILKSVAMIDGSVSNVNKKNEYTVYTVCYSAKSKTCYYNHFDDFSLQKYELNEQNMNSDKITVYE